MDLRSFWSDETGQDLIEYSLILTFLVLVACAVFPFNQQAISTILSKTNVNLHSAVDAMQ
jgi:Flp pilus assembly pilin Flp